jgi:hypothetical protein
VYYIVGALEVLLVFRLGLKILGANPDSGFVLFIYTLSQPFVAPFNGIFQNVGSTASGIVSVLEPGVLLAMLIYGLLGWALVRLLTGAMSERY